MKSLSRLNDVSLLDVLVVEDEVPQADEIVYFLKKVGLRVESAQSAAEAREIVRQKLPLIALVDCRLPDSNGIVLSATIEALSPSTAVILVSGEVEGVPESLLKATRARAFINKPLPLGLLGRAIQNLLRGIERGHDHAPKEPSWFSAGIASPSPKAIS